MINLNCVPCFYRQARRLFDKFQISPDRRDVLMRRFEHFINNEGVHYPSPLSAQYLNRLVKEETGVEDLYIEEKRFYNKILLERYERLKAEVGKSEQPEITALKYALAGNIIDFGPPHSFNLDKTFSEAMSKEISVDHSSRFFEAVKNARMVLYLADNAGEIVADKLFIETLNHPNVVFVTRGRPVLNDVTLQDAEDVGMSSVARVVHNGFDAPSTLLEFCSEAFQSLFDEADVVVSKGQGNFEGLYRQTNKENLFFLFMVKCDEIARITGQDKGSAVIMQNIS